MPDEFGFLAGAKGISEGVNTGKEAGKQIGKSIEDVQKEAASVAQQRAQERRRAAREAELKKQRAIFKALEEYRRRDLITKEEHKAKVDFVRQYGSKQWDEVLKIKNEIEKAEQLNEKLFNADLAKSKRVMFYCYFVAAWIAWYLVWGHKQ